MSKVKSDLLNACQNGQMGKIQQLFVNNMFAVDVYQDAANICIRNNHTEAFCLVVKQPLVCHNPKWSWEGLCITAMDHNRPDILEYCLSQAPEKQIANLYRFSIVLNKHEGFHIIDKVVTDDIRAATANQLERSTHPSIIRRVFPFSLDPVRDFRPIFFCDNLELCADMVGMRPELKHWLEEQCNVSWAGERAQNILNLVQRAEISAQLPETQNKTRKM